MQYQLPNGKVINLSLDQFLDMTDEDEKVTVTVKEFRGYHDYSTYLVESMIVKGNSTLLDTTYVNLKDLEVIEEF